ncbi:MAG: protein kinase [Planctomycetota bacterium]
MAKDPRDSRRNRPQPPPPPPPPPRRGSQRPEDAPIDATLEPRSRRVAPQPQAPPSAGLPPPRAGSNRPQDVDVSAPTIDIDMSRRPPVATILGLDEQEHVDLQKTVADGQSGVHVSLPPLKTQPGSSSSRTSGRLAGVARSGSTIDVSIDAHGKYLIEGELARGGMGAILRGFDRDIRRNIAMKVMLSDTPKKSQVARFLEEAQVTGQLEHPNIVPVHEVGVDDRNRLYFTMKLVRGQSLKERLGEIRASVMKGRGDEAFPLMERIDIFRKICDAIAFAHSKGVIHRDLKAENVMLGEFGEVQVMDWGIARVTGRSDKSGGEAVISDRVDEGIARTMDGAVAGTPAYMSPEQARGEIAKIDQRSDVFSLGAILYEMVTFTAPYRGESVWKVLDKARKGVVQAPSSRIEQDYGNVRGGTVRRAGGAAGGAELRSTGGAPAIPRELEAVVMKAMARAPMERYRNVRELRNDIDAWAEGRTLRAADYSTWQLFSKWVQRNKAAAIGTAATLLVGIVGLIVIFAMNAAADERRINEVAAAAVQAEQTTRAEESKKALDKKRAAAGELWSAGLELLHAAQKVPFNESSPQAYLFARLPAARRLGRALQDHPDAPAGWREQLDNLCRELQANCEKVGDYALAQHVAGSARDWGAISESEETTRLAHTEAVRQQQIEADRKRLQDVLGKIRNAENGNSGLPDDGHRLVPGEIDERARQVAALDSAEVTRDLMTTVMADLSARQAGNTNGVMGTAERRCALFALSLRGDIHEAAEGKRLPDLARDVLGTPPAFMGNDEFAEWIWLAARLQAQHAAFGEGAAISSLVPPAYTSETSSWKRDLDQVQQWLDLAQNRRGSMLPVPSDHPHDMFVDTPEYLQSVSSLGDLLARTARSGSAYTRLLLQVGQSGKLPDGRRLSTRELVFVIDQLGLYGDTRPPDADDPESAAPVVLQQTLDALPDLWVGLRPPAGVDQTAWHARRILGLAAALNLARLNVTDSAAAIYRKRAASPQHSVFWNRLLLPLQLMPADAATVANEQPAGTDTSEVDRLATEAKAEADAGNHQRAIELYTRVLALEPHRSGARAGRAFSHMLLNHLREAEQDYTEAIRIEPGRGDLYVARAAVYLRTREPQKAMDDYDRAVQVDPSAITAWVNRSTLRGQQGDFAGAISDLTMALRIDPKQPVAWRNTAVCRVQLADRTSDPAAKRQLLLDALTAFDNCLRLAPDNAGAFADRGATRVRLGDYRTALEDFDRAIRLEPDRGGNYQLRAECYAKLANEYPAGSTEADEWNQRALRDCAKWIELEPENPGSYINRGVTLLNMSRNDDAERDLLAALRLDARNYAAWMYIGVLRGIRRDNRGAHEAFDKAAAFAPAGAKATVEGYRQRYAGPR